MSVGTVRTFMDSMQQQLDFLVEAQNLDEFTKDFADEICVSFPVPVWPYVSPSVHIEHPFMHHPCPRLLFIR